MKDRVLGQFGFEPFPERLEQQAIKQGNKEAPADTGAPEPIIHSNAVAKRELALKMNEEAKIQAEMDKVIKERAVKKALDEKAYEEAKAKEVALAKAKENYTPENAILLATEKASAKAKKL